MTEDEAMRLAYKVMLDTMVEVRLYAEKLMRSSVPSEQATGADLMQIIEGGSA